MTWKAEVRDALRRHGLPEDDDIVEELAQHATASFETARADGLSTGAASDHVRQLIDGWSRGATRPRRPNEIRRGGTGLARASETRPPSLIGLVQDVRYGIRLLRRQPGFALLAILLIALGVGAATTLGHVTYAVLVQPLRWPGADLIVLVSETREGQTRTFPGILTNATYLAWRDAPSTLDNIAGYTSRVATLTVGDGPERIRVASATASLFAVLQARALQGQLYTADNETEGGDQVIAIGFGLWQRRFGERMDAIGSTLELDGDRYRIVAVMPQGFAFPTTATQAWIPMRVPPVLNAGDPQARSISLFRAVGRLRDGATTSQAAAEGTARARSAPSLGLVGTAVFGTQGPPRVSAQPYLESITADVRPGLLMPLAAVALLLFAAIANVAGMQLARASTRRREVAIRSALGAGAGRLARQLLTENLIIGAAGGIVGWLLSVGLHHLLPQMLPADFPRADEIPSDWRVLALAIGCAMSASLVFGSLPAVLARRINLVETLVEDGSAPIGHGLRSRVGRMRTAVMIGQVAVAAVLLVGASLLGRSLAALMAADRGFDPRNLVTATLPMPERDVPAAQRAALLQTIVLRMSHLPGVTAAAVGSVLPLLPFDQPMAFQMPSLRGGNETVSVQADLRTVSPQYFRALGVPLVEGRDFSDSDSPASQPVVIVNRAFVRTYLQGQALGVRLPILGPDAAHAHEIIGVADDVRQRGATDPPKPELYMTYRQAPEAFRMPAPMLVARTSGNPADLVGPLRSLVVEANPRLALDSVMTMDERLIASLARPRLYAVLLAGFGAFALLVAGAGLFGVLSYSVAQRSREIGVRAALGAQPRNIISLVLRQGFVVTGTGLVIGLAAAALLVRFVSSMLYGVTTDDPVTYVIVTVALAVAAALASIVPARRAARIDPLRAMRR